jgi:hypothetical protein
LILKVDESSSTFFICIRPNVVINKSRGTLNSNFLISRLAGVDTIAFIFSMKIQLLIIGLFTTLSCSIKTENKTNTSNNGQPEAKETEIALYKSEALRNFSSTINKDSFSITVTGQSIKDGQFRLQIIANDGLTILDESFETTMLLDYGLKDNSTDAEKEQYIKERIDNFFKDENFHQPAISSDDTFDEDYGKREVWDDIIADQTSVGFYYLIGKEDGRHIAYSKKLGKVVLYYNCC